MATLWCILVALIVWVMFIFVVGKQMVSEIKKEDLRDYQGRGYYTALTMGNSFFIPRSPTILLPLKPTLSGGIQELPKARRFRDANECLNANMPGYLLAPTRNLIINASAFEKISQFPGDSFTIRYRANIVSTVPKIVLLVFGLSLLLALFISKQFRQYMVVPSKKFIVRALLVVWVGMPTLYMFWIMKIDPINRYSLPDDRTVYLSNQVSRIAGPVHSHEYNSIILGTSISQNMPAKAFSDIFNVNGINFTLAGSTVVDQQKVAVGVLHNRPINTIIWELHLTSFTQPIGTTKQGSEAYFLFDKDPVNDIQYWMGQKGAADAILAQKSVGYIKTTKLFDDTMKWSRDFSGTMLYEQQCKTNDYDVSELDYYLIQKNLEIFVLPIVKKYPDTQFYFYIPPYSSSYYARGYSAQSVYEASELIRTILAPYNNIHFTSFIAEKSIINNVEDYRDDYHFKPEVNVDLLNKIKAQKNSVLSREKMLNIMESGAQAFSIAAKNFCAEK